ncbi:MAG: endonuclease III [Candidatus Kapabacteria bacterium]|nr:endonuclease III [Candidatus Kapabacteria bacterium]MCS7169802.1 endonuclease III [Candidatus Kapabacteria bacterium]MDW7997295.1 endonuclease III [Bacteroidota bacterium]MDW8224682.1 endonuclease III [Bacteroidota bacterium]
MSPQAHASDENERRRMAEVLRRLHAEYPEARIRLRFRTPFELLIATILSAQCTDDRVNQVTKSLFQKYRTPEDYLRVPVEELEQDIYPTGYYKAKARSIRECCRILLERFGGQIPQSLEEFTTLPGVGRKTANVVLNEFVEPQGIVVDTHVARVVQRLGFATTDNRERIEYRLMELVPRSEWARFAHLVMAHGRAICKARNPRCRECTLRDICPFPERE